MANFTTDSKICIEREIEILPAKVDDLLARFDVIETCKWISDNNFPKVTYNVYSIQYLIRIVWSPFNIFYYFAF
jgi:hypothetical protein